MLRKIDWFIVVRLDSLCRWAQKRGMSLTRAHCVAAAASLLFNLADLRYYPVSFVIMGTLFSVILYGTLAWASDNADYKTNVRKCAALNAKAKDLLETSVLSRSLWLFMTFALVPWYLLRVDMADRSTFTFVMSFVAPTLMFYLYPVTFVGAEEQRSESPDAVREGAQ